VLDSATVLYPEDFLTIRTLQQNFGRRPLIWSLTTGGRYYGLDPLLVQRGLGLEVGPTQPDTANPALDFSGLFAAPLDMPVTRRLALETYRYAELLERRHGTLESTAQGIAQTMTVPLTQLALAALAREDHAAAREYLERAAAIAMTEMTRRLLEQARAAAAFSLPLDSLRPAPIDTPR
jgi:hypothetical protein